VSQPAFLLGFYFLIYLPMIVFAYGRLQRWWGMAGWLLLMGGLLLATGGAGELFAWAGLLWSVVSAFGGLLVVMDVIAAKRMTSDR
jgi:hypothetical protein